MSNRLNMAHGAVRLDARSALPLVRPRRGAVAGALRWLARLAGPDADLLSPAVRRDLGLPVLTTVPFAYDAERSRVRI